ncbi:hypothetical protein BH24ACI2_BH24ACI2_12190 [soil metagenome]
MSENTISDNETTAGQTKAAAETAAPTETVTSEIEATKPAETEDVVTSAIVKIEGQEFPLDVAIATDDELLKTALSPHYPSIKNAAITRETRTGQMIVSIVKKAEHKGAVRK